MTRNLICSVVVAAALVTATQAALIDISITHPDASAVLPGVVVNDLNITFAGEWTGIQLLTSEMPGQIYQHPYGGNTPPNSNLVAAFPDLEFDTFMANGGTTDLTDNGVLEVGASVNLGGPGVKRFDTDVLDVTWAPQTGTHPTDLTDYFVGRITLSDTANGSFMMLVATPQAPAGGQPLVGGQGGDIEVLEGTITNGVMSIIPEPASLTLLGLGGLLIARRRR